MIKTELVIEALAQVVLLNVAREKHPPTIEEGDTDTYESLFEGYAYLTELSMAFITQAAQECPEGFAYVKEKAKARSIEILAEIEEDPITEYLAEYTKSKDEPIH